MNMRILTGVIMCGLAATTFAQERVVDADAVAPPASSEAGFYKASDLIGMEVRGTDNEDLGEVQDLFIDRTTNEVEYLILDTGVFADLGGKQPIIPWTIVDLQTGADADTFFLSLPLTQERIRTAPTIALGEVDLTASQTWVADVDQFYSAELRERRVSRPDLDQSRDAAPRSRRDTDPDAPDRPRRERDATDVERDSTRPDATNQRNRRQDATDRPSRTPDANRPSRTPDANRPDANRPNRTPDANRPNPNRPGSTPDANRPNSTPGANKPDANKPDANKPDANKPDANKPANP